MGVPLFDARSEDKRVAVLAGRVARTRFSSSFTSPRTAAMSSNLKRINPVQDLQQLGDQAAAAAAAALSSVEDNNPLKIRVLKQEVEAYKALLIAAAARQQLAESAVHRLGGEEALTALQASYEPPCSESGSPLLVRGSTRA